jgi:hypothetical protein
MNTAGLRDGLERFIGIDLFVPLIRLSGRFHG